MLDVVELDGKFINYDDSQLLSVQAVVKAKPDEDGYMPTEYSEEVKLLDVDGFELDSIYLSFKPFEKNKYIFSTETLMLDEDISVDELKYIELFGRKVEIQKSNEKDLRLATRVENLAANNNRSAWVPSLAGKVIPKSDEVLISIKASICPQPSEDEDTDDSYFEEVKLLDVEGYEVESVYLEFKNTQSLKESQATGSTSLYDVDPSMIKYIKLLDVVVSLASKVKINLTS